MLCDPQPNGVLRGDVTLCGPFPVALDSAVKGLSGSQVGWFDGHQWSERRLARPRACGGRSVCPSQARGATRRPPPHRMIELGQQEGLEPPTKSLGTPHLYCHVLYRNVTHWLQVAQSSRLPRSA
jgi:hypothetical protein